MKFLLVISCLVFTIFTGDCSAFEYKQWWENWYCQGGGSGDGSRGILAEYKAAVINDFIEEHKIVTAIEFGCGDGVNLNLIKYKQYLGFDVSKKAIEMCMSTFKNDLSKSFMLYDPNYFVNNTVKNIDLVVCLDVLYHVLDENEYIKVLDDIFSYSSSYVILYTTLKDEGFGESSEIFHRDVMQYLNKYSEYDVSIVKQKHQHLTNADFIFLTKRDKEN